MGSKPDLGGYAGRFFSWEESEKGKEAGLTEILDTLIDDAYERGVLEENSVVYRDLLIQNSWAA